MDDSAYKFSEEDIAWMLGLLEQAKVESASRELAIKILETYGGEGKPIAHMMDTEQLAQLYKELNDKELGRQ